MLQLGLVIVGQFIAFDPTFLMDFSFGGILASFVLFLASFFLTVKIEQERSKKTEEAL